MFKNTVCAMITAAAAAGCLVSCSDDVWDVELFLWPPLERTVPHGEIKVYPAESGDVNKVVVRLWGSRYEVGYAHGQLLGSQIVVLITNNLVKEIDRDDYEALCRGIDVAFDWPPEAELELEGILAGMRDDGRNLWLEDLDRELGVADLKVWNAYPDLGGLPGGQAFAVWGDASAYRTPLAARNFEMYPGAERYLASTWPVMAYRAEGLPFAAVAPPGYVGVLTGVSRTGVYVFANRGDGAREGVGGRPVGLLLRQFLTSSYKPADADADLERLARDHNRFGSWNLLAVTPVRLASRTDHPEFGCVVECDAAKVVTRYTDDVWPDNKKHNTIFATNTHRLLNGAKGSGGDPAYVRLVARVNAVLSEGPFTETEAGDVLYEVAGPENSHSLINFINLDGAFVLLAVSDGEGRAMDSGDFQYFVWRDFWP